MPAPRTPINLLQQPTGALLDGIHHPIIDVVAQLDGEIPLVVAVRQAAVPLQAGVVMAHHVGLADAGDVGGGPLFVHVLRPVAEAAAGDQVEGRGGGR